MFLYFFSYFLGTFHFRLFRAISSVCCTSFLWRLARLAKHMTQLIFRFSLGSNSYLRHSANISGDRASVYHVFLLCTVLHL